jgi:hypothetical protein
MISIQLIAQEIMVIQAPVAIRDIGGQIPKKPGVEQLTEAAGHR